MRRITWPSRHKFFKNGFKKGEICTYSSSFFFKEVEVFARKCGTIIRRFKFGSDEHKKYGPCFEVLDGPTVSDGEKKEQLFHYDIKQLM